MECFFGLVYYKHHFLPRDMEELSLLCWYSFVKMLTLTLCLEDRVRQRLWFQDVDIGHNRSPKPRRERSSTARDFQSKISRIKMTILAAILARSKLISEWTIIPSNLAPNILASTNLECVFITASVSLNGCCVGKFPVAKLGLFVAQRMQKQLTTTIANREVVR